MRSRTNFDDMATNNIQFSSNSVCIVMSGLPASGKSTVGKELAKVLNLPCLDKDDYLERQFAEKGVGDRVWRQSLSLRSNRLFEKDAQQHLHVILISHWRPEGYSKYSGTPIAWINAHYDRVIEVYCQSTIDDATNRFVQRERHPGHLDKEKSRKEIVEWMHRYEEYLPLNLGGLVTINNTSNLSVIGVADSIRRLINYEN